MAVDSDYQKKEEHLVKIYTLGRFAIKRGDLILSDGANRSKKAWDLFKFLLAHREKNIHSEMILETLWPEQEYADSNLAMRSLVFRLRQLLEKELQAPEIAASITFAHGCYKFDAQQHFWLDTDQFTLLYQKAQNIEDTNQAIAAFQEAASLYKGDFLPDCAYYEWALPQRNHYHRLYLQIVFALTALLKKSRRYSEIIELCEQSFMIEYFEEELHLRYIEALLAEKKARQARMHYDEVTTTFYRELGAKPSAEMRNMLRVLKMDYDNFDLDLTIIQEGLRDRQLVDGAFYCDTEVFRHLYKLERSRGERSGRSVFLGLLTITAPDYRLPDQNTLDQAMAHLQDVLISSLRKGDIVTRWNKAQFLILLPGVTLPQSEMVLKRVENNFKKAYPLDRLLLHKKQQPLLPVEQYLTGP